MSGVGAKQATGYSRPTADLPSSFSMAVNNTSIVEFVGTDKQAGDVRLA